MTTETTTDTRAPALTWRRCECISCNGAGRYLLTTVLGKTYSVCEYRGAVAHSFMLIMGHHQNHGQGESVHNSLGEADAELRRLLAPEIAKAKNWIAENEHLFPAA